MSRGSKTYLTYCGVTHNLVEWSEICGISVQAIQNRLWRGATTAQALNPSKEKDLTSKQPCWTCKKACGRCAWSRKPNPQPIRGWLATPTMLTVARDTKCSSYNIRFCPEYEYDGSNERGAYQNAE